MTADYTTIFALALAPAFLLSATCSLLTLLTGKLERIREILRDSAATESPNQSKVDRARARLTDRARLLYRAVRLTTFASVVIALTVLAIFVNKALGFSREWGASILFVLSIILIIRALLMLYKEIGISRRSFEDGEY